MIVGTSVVSIYPGVGLQLRVGPIVAALTSVASNPDVELCLNRTNPENACSEQSRC